MAISRTAEYVALYRALENLEPHPLFRDRFAAGFLSNELRRLVRAARFRPLRALLVRYADLRAPGARTSAIARTCFIDEVVRTRVAAGVRQVVLLGAGFDCRAHRMPELRASAVYEVDRPETQEWKRERIARAAAHFGGQVRPDVRYVQADFLRDQVSRRLADAGWEIDRPTLFIWEGVTAYLTESAVRSTLSWIARSAASSTVVFTYLHGGLLDGSADFKGAKRILANVRALGEPWTFGLRPEALAGFLASCGLALREESGADEYRLRYLGARSHAQSGYAFYRIAVAEVARVDSPTEK